MMHTLFPAHPMPPKSSIINLIIDYNHGFHAGSILQMLSKLDAAVISVVTCDLPVSKSAKSIDRQNG